MGRQAGDRPERRRGLRSQRSRIHRASHVHHRVYQRPRRAHRGRHDREGIAPLGCRRRRQEVRRRHQRRRGGGERRPVRHRVRALGRHADGRDREGRLPRAGGP